MSALRHRLPVSVRHHWRLLVASVVLVAVTLGVLGAYRVRPLVLTQGDDYSESSTVDIAGTVDLFDTSVAHTMALAFDQDAYDRMVRAFQSGNEKEYLEADLTIDGTVLPSVGIRLKGNSTLRALGGGGFRGGGPAGTTLSFDNPEELPWLISFDHFVEDRRYQDRENIALRPAGQTGSTLNEAVALQLVGLSGEPTQRWTYSALTVNGRPATARLAIEVPDKPYASALGRGVLYKALSTSSFTDQGEDPTAYIDDFDQVNRKGSQDRQPVIDLIRWVNSATDEEFAENLDQWLDVESFARYVALQNLLINFDDMAGPGRNYYLYYDLDTKLFRVITWDLNLALSGATNQGPFDAATMGGGFRGGGQPTVPGGAGPTVVQGPGAAPGGVAPGGAAPGGAVPGGVVRGGPGGGNKLKERFLAAEAFKDRYLDVYRELYSKIFAGGAALDALDRAVQAAARAGSTVTDAQANTLRATITARTTALSTNQYLQD